MEKIQKAIDYWNTYLTTGDKRSLAEAKKLVKGIKEDNFNHSTSKLIQAIRKA